MKLEIIHSQKTREIKERFNMDFPFLKIEFFTHPHAPGEATSIVNMVQDDTMLGQINNRLCDGSIAVSPDDSVAFIEQIFQQKFGLPIQVFRKQRDSWIETTKTDQLTLFQQNEKAKEACMPVMHADPGDRYLDDGQY